MLSLIFNPLLQKLIVGQDTSVGIATGYGLDGPEFEFQLGRSLKDLSRTAVEPNQPPVQWVPGLPGGKERSRRGADHSLTSSALVNKE